MIMSVWISEVIKADVWRYYGNYSAKLLVKCFLTQRTFRPVLSLRLCQLTKNKFPLLFPVVYLLHLFFQSSAGLELPWKTNVGAGFKITHGFGVVINASVRIGRNVTILQGVTIGEKITGKSAGAPTLEDGVTIGAGAIVIGNVVLGAYSTVGAGALVTRDVPAYAIAANHPAHIIKQNTGIRVRNPYPEIEV